MLLFFCWQYKTVVLTSSSVAMAVASQPSGSVTAMMTAVTWVMKLTAVSDPCWPSFFNPSSLYYYYALDCCLLAAIVRKQPHGRPLLFKWGSDSTYPSLSQCSAASQNLSVALYKLDTRMEKSVFHGCSWFATSKWVWQNELFSVDFLDAKYIACVCQYWSFSFTESLM